MYILWVRNRNSLSIKKEGREGHKARRREGGATSSWETPASPGVAAARWPGEVWCSCQPTAASFQQQLPQMASSPWHLLTL